MVSDDIRGCSMPFLRIGEVEFPADSINITDRRDRVPAQTPPYSPLQFAASYEFKAVLENGDEWGAFVDGFVGRMPRYVDLTMTKTGLRLRVLREHRHIAHGTKHVVSMTLVQGPRMADGRWSPQERAR